MKVLMVDQIAMINYKYSFSLAEALREHGVDITLIADYKEKEELYRFKIENIFKTSNKSIGKVEKLFNYISSMRYLVNKAIKEEYDVVHVQWFQFSPVDYFYLSKLKKNRIRLVVTVHDILPFNSKFYDKYFHKKIYKIADSIILQAENNLNRFKKLFLEESVKTTLVPHGNFIDHVNFKGKDESIEYLNLPKDKTILLFFGQIKKVKGLGDLLEAFGNLIKKREDIYLVIAGNVWKDDFSVYQNIINKYEINEKIRTDIRFIPDDEVEYYYSASDLVILPYKDVYQSGVIQLSYAYAKPVVATDIGPFKEIVFDGENGFLCKPNNPKSIEDTIERAINRKNDFEKMGQNGRKLIEKNFSWKDIASNINRIYKI